MDGWNGSDHYSNVFVTNSTHVILLASFPVSDLFRQYDNGMGSWGGLGTRLKLDHIIKQDINNHYTA